AWIGVCSIRRLCMVPRLGLKALEPANPLRSYLLTEILDPPGVGCIGRPAPGNPRVIDSHPVKAPASLSEASTVRHASCVLIFEKYLKIVNTFGARAELEPWRFKLMWNIIFVAQTPCS